MPKPTPITPPIKASRQTVLPAVPERVYDQWKLSGIHIDGTGIGEDIAAGYARYRKCRTLEDGSIELGPADDVVTVPFENVSAVAVQFPEIHAAVEANHAAGVAVGTARGLL